MKLIKRFQPGGNFTNRTDAIPDTHKDVELEQYSADKTKADKINKNVRNHSDERIKKYITVPVLYKDYNGDYQITQQTMLAPGEDSAQINTFFEEMVPVDKTLSLLGTLGKTVLTKTGQNAVAHWARNSLLAEEFANFGNKGITTTVAQKIIPAESPKQAPKTSLKFYERKPSNISSAERAGVPKGERNQPFKEKIPEQTYLESPDIPTFTHKYSKIREIPISSIDNLENLNYNIFHYLKQLEKDPSIKIREEFLSPQYITAARNYYNNLGYPVNQSISDETIAKLLTKNYYDLTQAQNGVLKGKVLWHGSPDKPFETLDASKVGSNTGNKGLYGEGFYLTNYPNNYGQFSIGFDYPDYIFHNNSQPFLVQGIKKLGGNAHSYDNSYGLAWHQPEGRLTLPYGINRTYDHIHVFDNNPYGLSEGWHYTRWRNGKLELAPENFKGYQVQESKIIDGKKVVSKPGTGYKVALGNNSWLNQEPGRAFQSYQTITPESSFGGLIREFTQDGVTYPATEIVVPYSTRVKSLFPHPDSFIRNSDGTFSFKRDWNNSKLNFKQGGKVLRK